MKMHFDFAAWTDARLLTVERALDAWVPQRAPAGLGDGMRYAVLDGGKRLRPLLVLAARESVAQGDTHEALDEAALRAACSVELIHAYSLVHDDMPCMDNDILRRGKPTVHVKFGEAGALLAGDALQALAFEILTPQDSDIPAEVQVRLCQRLARAAGHAGMAGGQAIDLASVGVALNEAQLREMHRLKTGALLEASVLLGADCAPQPASAWPALQTYAQALGVAFQVVDDVLDVVSDAATLGKTVGKDAANDKPTFVSLMGLDRSRQYAQELLAQSLQALDQSGLPRTEALRALAHMVVNRNN